mmetsp:Transcript_4992/g.15174  ORF Transcript_4992/g.15174 Transcript_4992/m.15174 type:complete len:272 (+) Transcript_4992:156-971(+)
MDAACIAAVAVAPSREFASPASACAACTGTASAPSPPEPGPSSQALCNNSAAAPATYPATAPTPSPREVASSASACDVAAAASQAQPSMAVSSSPGTEAGVDLAVGMLSHAGFRALDPPPPGEADRLRLRLGLRLRLQRRPCFRSSAHVGGAPPRMPSPLLLRAWLRPSPRCCDAPSLAAWLRQIDLPLAVAPAEAVAPTEAVAPAEASRSEAPAWDRLRSRGDDNTNEKSSSGCATVWAAVELSGRVGAVSAAAMDVGFEGCKCCEGCAT